MNDSVLFIFLNWKILSFVRDAKLVPIFKDHLHGAMHRAIDRPIDRKRPDRTV